EKGGDPDLIAEYRVIRRRTIISRRLIVVLGRIYPIRTEGKFETDFDIPELHEVINRYESDKNRCLELQKILLG
ncbi:MAG: hypothetical protein V1862_01905, partial [Methanobacteriota archaeon]